MAQTQRRTAPQNHGTLSSDLQILLQDFTSEILEQTCRSLPFGCRALQLLTIIWPDLDDCEPDACKKLRNVANNLLCDPKSVRVEALDDVIDSAYKRMSASAGTAQSLPCRRLYTDTSILKALRCASQPEDARQLVSAVTSLDKAIVLAGAPGEGRLDLIQRLIATIQSHLVPVTSSTSSRESMLNFPARPAFIPVSSCTNSVLHLSDPPPLSSFRVKYSQRPFILPGFIKDWPALEEHPWASLSYLRSVAGPGRVVPVEIGSDYRTDDWTQTMMEWDDFLDALRAANISDAQPPLYLAQHNLMAQFPRLRNDVIIPDYVYACPPAPPDYSDYKPPTNDDELVMNVWLGPGGTMSPAHTVYFTLVPPRARRH